MHGYMEPLFTLNMMAGDGEIREPITPEDEILAVSSRKTFI